MELAAYLSRINVRGPLNPTLETLRLLQTAHMISVPFENLDIHLGRPIQLDEVALYEKIVRRHRGGFCYELNGLFAVLLKELGYQVTLLAARVFNAEGVLGPEFDHLALLIDLEERWLADVGFGNSSLAPLRLVDPKPQFDGRLAYRLSQEQGLWTVSRQADDGGWKADYQFTLQPRQMSDFAEACRYQQTSPESPFTQRWLCTVATTEGRITLRGMPGDMRLTATANGHKHETPIESEQALSEILRDQFTIDLA